MNKKFHTSGGDVFKKKKCQKGTAYTTLEFKINISRAIPLGTLLEAIGTIRHSDRSTGVDNGEIRGVDDDRLHATGSTTCLIMKPR